MIFPVGIKRFETDAQDDGSVIEVVALYAAHVGGIAFYARDSFPWFGARVFSRDGAFKVPDDIASYEYD